MSGYAIVHATGVLSADPHISTTTSGNPIAFLVLATRERVIRNGARKVETYHHHVLVISPALVSKVVQPYCRRGRTLQITGSLQYTPAPTEDDPYARRARIVIRPYQGDLRLIDRLPQEAPADSDDGERTPPPDTHLDFDPSDPEPDDVPVAGSPARPAE